MAVAGIATVKDEADVIAGTLLHLADEVDFLLVIDNGSLDGTREILAELSDNLPLTVIDDPEVGYYQSKRMTRLAAQAAEQGAAWIVPFDADELWVHRGDRISTELRATRADIVSADLYNHFPSAIDPEGVDPYETIIWRQRDPAPLPKVAFRWHPSVTVDQGNHGATYHGVIHPRLATGLEVRHFPYRTAEQFVRKARNGAAAYAATDLPDNVGAHWRGYGDILTRLGPTALEEVFREHFWHLSPVDHGLIPDPAPYLRWRQS